MRILKRKNKPKIDFAIIGTQKGGTSALDYYLRQHPEIGMASKKETHFFDNEKVFSKFKISYRKLEKEFDFSSGKKLYGEATPIYMYWKPAIRRIWEYNKEIKLIIVLRNPVDRAFSHWNMELSRNAEQDDFFYCIKNESERIKEALPFQHRVYSYVERGFYSQQLKQILKLFPREQLYIIKYEDFKVNQQKVLNQIFEFLNVALDNYSFKEKQIHSRPYNTKITKREREYLLQIFNEDIKEVEKELDWDCSDWKTISKNNK